MLQPEVFRKAKFCIEESTCEIIGNFRAAVVIRRPDNCAPLLSLRYPQGRTQGLGGLGLNPPFELDILQKLYYLRKEIKCFRILFAC